MGHGGSRPGAGRKPGGKNRKTQAIVLKATAEGITPLEVMLNAMCDAYARGQFAQAAAFAEKCAPYMHPRLASFTADVQKNVDHQACPIRAGGRRRGDREWKSP